MESYVERWAREKAQKEQKGKKSQKGQKAKLSSVYGEMKKKEVQKDGTDTRSEGHEAQAESSSGEPSL